VEQESFSYQINKQRQVRIFWQNRCVMTLGGARGEQLANALLEAGDEEVQYLLQRITGNFKRGNERKVRKQRH
jgi:hypothetical protein